MYNVKLVRHLNKLEHYSIDTVDEFERSIICLGVPIHKEFALNKNLIYSRISYSLEKRRIIIPLQIMYPDTILFSILMGGHFYLHRAEYQFCKHNAVYLFDAWPKDQEKMAFYLQKYKIQFVFLSSLQATQMMKKTYPFLNLYYIPEGVNVKQYRQRENRKIDVLQFGRRYERVHQDLIKNLDSQYTYLFQECNKPLMFLTTNEFIEGLANAKISLCFPRNITHPEDTGKISTMTVRYLQSMASKCLVVGIMPEEMKELFDYIPVIELDMANPAEHIADILQNYDKYIPLVEKNYNYVCAYHTWEKRWESICEILNKFD